MVSTIPSDNPRRLGRTLNWPLATVLALAGASTAVIVGSAGTAAAAATPAPPSTSPVVTTNYPSAALQAWVGSGVSTVDLPVPRGLTPTILTGRLTAQIGGSSLQAEVLVGDRVVADVHGGSRTLHAVVSASDLSTADGGSPLVLPVSVKVVDATGSWARCIDADVSVALKNLSLTLSGVATSPTTVASFFDSTVTDVSVMLPRSATVAGAAELAQAGLQAVASLTHRYGDSGTGDARVRLVVGDPAPTLQTLGHRVLRLLPAAGSVVTGISTVAGVPTLTMSGSPTALASAVTALASEQIALGDSARTDGLTATMSSSASLSSTLAGLGSSKNVRLSGYGQSSSYLGVHQAQFGGAIASAQLHLVGTATPAPQGAQARLSIYWNDYLLASTPTNLSARINMNVSIPASQIQRDNGLTLRLDALPDRGDCRAGGLPIEVDIDGTRSTISAVRGQSLGAGFQRFPQVLSGHLPVAFGAGDESSTLLEQAAHYVAALQAITTVPLDVRTVSAAAFVSGSARSQSGLLVGATPDQVTRLKAPLRLAAFRQINQSASPFGVSINGAFAALEAFRSGSRDVLLAAGWSPSGNRVPDVVTLMDQLATVADSVGSGWSGLSKSLVVATPGAVRPSQMDAGSLVPQDVIVREHSVIPSGVWYGGAILALLGLARMATVRRRLRRVRRYVDVEQNEQNASSSPGTGGAHRAFERGPGPQSGLSR